MMYCNYIIRLFLSLTMLFCYLHCCAQTDEVYYLRWKKNRILTVKDFKYHKEFHIPTPFAESAVDIYAEYSIKENKLDFLVFSYFDMYRSYIFDTVLKTYTNSTLLHEQCHFDICELYARKIRKHLIDHQFYYNVDSVIKYYKEQVIGMQSEFEEAASYGGDEFGQKQFCTGIKEKLDSLKAYSNPTGTVILK